MSTSSAFCVSISISCKSFEGWTTWWSYLPRYRTNRSSPGIWSVPHARLLFSCDMPDATSDGEIGSSRGRIHGSTSRISIQNTFTSSHLQSTDDLSWCVSLMDHIFKMGEGSAAFNRQWSWKRYIYCYGFYISRCDDLVYNTAGWKMFDNKMW